MFFLVFCSCWICLWCYWSERKWIFRPGRCTIYIMTLFQEEANPDLGLTGTGCVLQRKLCGLVFLGSVFWGSGLRVVTAGLGSMWCEQVCLCTWQRGLALSKVLGFPLTKNFGKPTCHDGSDMALVCRGLQQHLPGSPFVFRLVQIIR